LSQRAIFGAVLILGGILMVELKRGKGEKHQLDTEGAGTS